MTHSFDQVIDRRADFNLNKWRFYPEDALPLWVADMDFRTPDPILAELQRALQHGILGYELASPALLELVAGRLHWLYGCVVAPEWIVPVLNVGVADRLVASLFCSAGQGVLVQPPVFHDRVEFPHLSGLALQEAPLRRVDQDQLLRYELDLDSFRRTIHSGGAQTAMFLLCNSHNPVGGVFTEDEASGLAGVCGEHGILLCSNDIHSELILDSAGYGPLAAWAVLLP